MPTPPHAPKCVSPGLFLSSGYSQEVVCYTLGNIPQMPSAPRLVRAGVTWVTLQWSKPEGCSPEEVVTYTLEIQEDENVSLAHVMLLCAFCKVSFVTATGYTVKLDSLPIGNQILNFYQGNHQQNTVLPTVFPRSVNGIPDLSFGEARNPWGHP